MTAAITSIAPRAVTNSRTAKYLRDFLLGILPIMFGAQLFGWIAFFPQALHGNSDFRQLYTAAYMIRTGRGHQLYDYQAQKQLQDALVSREELALPFIRPAYQAVVMVPFSLFRYRTAYLLFLALNLGLVSLWVIGLAQAKVFVQSLFAVGGAVAPAANQIKFPLRTTLMANLRGLVAGLTAGRLSSSTILILTILLSGAVLALAIRLLRKQ